VVLVNRAAVIGADIDFRKIIQLTYPEVKPLDDLEL
jgi:hypothetical protein